MNNIKKKICIGIILIIAMLMVGGVNAEPVSIQAVSGFDEDSVDIGSSEYQLYDTIKINLTEATDIVLFSTLNAEKISGIENNELSVRYSLNGDYIYDKVIRSIDDVDEVGSIAYIINIEATEGENIITQEYKRTGDGVVSLYNINYILAKMRDNKGRNINHEYVNGSREFVGAGEFINTMNRTYSTSYNGRLLYIDSYRIMSDSSTLTKSYVTNYNTSESSHQALRDIIDSDSIGSVSNNYIYNDMVGGDDYTYQRYDYADTGTNIDVIGESVLIDLNVSSSDYIPNINNSNPSTDGTNYISIPEDTDVNILNGSVTMQNGTKLLSIGTLSVWSSPAGKFTMYGEIKNSTGDVICTKLKERTIKNRKIGNVNLYALCDSLTVGNTYSYNIYVNGTEPLRIYDGSLSILEATPYEFATELNPPVANDITQPLDNSRVCGNVDIDWIEFTDSGDIAYNVTLNNAFGRYIKTITTGTNITTASYDFVEENKGYYIIKVEGCNVAGCSSTEVKVYNNCYDEEAPQEQGLHLWVVIGLLIIIGFSIILSIKHNMISFGIFAAVLMIILSALLFNGIYWNVCESNAVDTHYCGTEYLDIPYWVRWSSQIMLVLLAFGMILESIVNNQNKPTTDESRGISWYK